MTPKVNSVTVSTDKVLP